jgi:hypothetical protein
MRAVEVANAQGETRVEAETGPLYEHASMSSVGPVERQIFPALAIRNRPDRVSGRDNLIDEERGRRFR